MGNGLAAPPPPPPPATATEGLGVWGQLTSSLALPCARSGALLPPWCAGAGTFVTPVGSEATDTQLPYDPRDTGHRSSPTTLSCCTAALFVQ